MDAKPSHALSGVILAGGLARRMGGRPKALQHYAGRPLLTYAIERLRPQVGELWLNVNHDPAAYQSFGLPLLADQIADYPGPLAGLHAALINVRSPWVLCVPCDSPHLPLDLGARLLAAVTTEQRRLAIARSGERTHPVFCLCHRALAASLATYLAAGERRVMHWCQQENAVEVDFPDPDAFANFNTLADLDR